MESTASKKIKIPSLKGRPRAVDVKDIRKLSAVDFVEILREHGGDLGAFCRHFHMPVERHDETVALALDKVSADREQMVEWTRLVRNFSTAKLASLEQRLLKDATNVRLEGMTKKDKAALASWLKSMRTMPSIDQKQNAPDAVPEPPVDQTAQAAIALMKQAKDGQDETTP